MVPKKEQVLGIETMIDGLLHFITCRKIKDSKASCSCGVENIYRTEKELT